MSREIKFRCWDTYNERMVDEPEKFIPTGPHHYTDDPKFNTPFQYYETWMDIEDGIHRPCHIMQYTGLKDKNGKEIYEGDIIKHNQNIYIVWWTENMGICLIHKKHFTPDKKSVLTTDNRQDFNFIWSTKKYIEVIGNIYQNPDLIQNPSQV